MFGAYLVGMGALSMLVQVVLLRELLASFFGNELSLGLVLTSWLLLVALGAGLGGRLAARWHAGASALVVCHVLLALVLPVELFLARAVGGGTAFPGQVIGPVQTAYLSALVLALPCVVVGALFALACRVAERTAEGRSDGSVSAVSWVYILEGAGAFLGGLLFHFELADRPESAAVVRDLMVLSSGLALIVVGDTRAGVDEPPVWLWAVAALAMLGSLSLRVWTPDLAKRTLARRWRGFELVHSENTRYGSLAITRLEGQLSFFHDGLLMFTTEDWQSAEESAHLPMLMHPRPRNVLFLSGGLGGALVEALKHPVEHVDYVELDRRAIELAREHLPGELQTPFSDPRVEFHYMDARAFVRDTRRRYDVIVVNLPDPSTANLSRFYTAGFFEELAGRLGPGGIVSTGLSSSEGYVTGPRRLLQSSVFRSGRLHLPHVLVVPGPQVTYLCARDRGALTADPAVLGERLAERGIETQFVNEFYLANLLMPFKAEQYLASLGSGPPARVNTEGDPVSYRYYLQAWLAEQAPGMARALGHWPWVLGGIGVLALVGVGGCLVGGRALPRATAVAIGVTGFVEMAVELLVIFGFQVAAGYVFHQIAILLALFMAGLTIGALAAERLAARAPQAALGALLISLAALAGYAFLLGWDDLRGFGDFVRNAGILAAIAGALGGFAFPLGIAVVSRPGGVKADRAAAGLYAADLVGGALGAVAISVILLPTLGFGMTLMALGLVSVAALALLALAAVVRR